MSDKSIYNDIAKRSGGDIYIGIVGHVRTGKSTFIKQFMDKLVIPNIDEEYLRERANDELPQSSSGRTIMTTEPKFIPEKGAEICIDDSAKMNVRLIDCVGYIVPSALGYIEGNEPRMVMTPWSESPLPFKSAAGIKGSASFIRCQIPKRKITFLFWKRITILRVIRSFMRSDIHGRFAQHLKPERIHAPCRIQHIITELPFNLLQINVIYMNHLKTERTCRLSKFPLFHKGF